MWTRKIVADVIEQRFSVTCPGSGRKNAEEDRLFSSEAHSKSLAAVKKVHEYLTERYPGIRKTADVS